MSPSEPSAPNADQRLIDKQMAGVIEAIMTHSYALANRGFIPSVQQIAGYIDSLDETTLLQKIRKHPGAASTRIIAADDQALLRWARRVGRDDGR